MLRVRLIASIAAALLAVAGTAVSASGTAQAAGGVGAGGQPATWNADQAHIAGAQNAGHEGAGVVVAVVDGWIDASHPDFAAADGSSRVLPGADCRTGICVNGPATPDACGHGTHVAGIVASGRYGVAPDATILPVVALEASPGNGCSGSAMAVAAAISWASSHGAQIINLSLADDDGPGLLGGPAVTVAIDAAAACGILVVVAAGNDGTTSDGPGYGDDALVVAATGPSGALASYSDQGPNVQLAAPGGDNGGGVCTLQTCIASTWIDHEYALLAGTSMAAPDVAGTAALILAAYPSAGRDRLMVALERTAHPIAGTEFGLLDAAAAVRLSASLATAPPSAAARALPSARVTPASASPHRSSSAKVPAPRTFPAPQSVPAHEAAATRSQGPQGPWLIAVVLLLAVSLALGWSVPIVFGRRR